MPLRGGQTNTHVEPQLWQLTWKWIHGPAAANDSQLLKRCSELYGREYGTWGDKGPRPGQAINISADRVRELVDHPEAWLACALHGETVIGYCIAVRLACSEGTIAWITQLVVASTYRQARVATQMLYSIWQFSDCYAWGLVTANPYAVRALETATRRRCRTHVIRQFGLGVLKRLSQIVKYIPPDFVVDPQGRLQPRVDTGFFVDHSDLSAMRAAAARRERRWDLGNIGDGEEWFACTFASQDPTAVSDERLAELLVGSDHIWIHAYEGMTLGSGHSWNKHTEDEVSLIQQWTKCAPGSQVLDIGCGEGRHALAFAGRGYAVNGVDISPQLIERARAQTDQDDMFAVGDCRDPAALPRGEYDLVICLYDVLGSSAAPADDDAILRAIRSRIAPHGYLVMTVLNTSATLPHLTAEARPRCLSHFISALEKLPASRTMEQTGAIFNLKLLLYYAGIYYRKEQFDAAPWRLPSELVVRDRRFTGREVLAMLDRSSFVVEELRPIQAGHWDVDPPLGEDDRRAKELLVIARPVL